MDGMASNVAVPLVATSVEENKWIKHEILVKEKGRHIQYSTYIKHLHQKRNLSIQSRIDLWREI